MNKFLFVLVSSCALLLNSIASIAQAQTLPTVSTNVKSTATLAATCTISVQNVNFGTLVLPINSQSASSTMSVQCSKNAPYTVGLAYGGIYGQGGVGNGDYWVHEGCPQACTVNWNWYYEYNSSGSFIAQQQFQNVLTNGALDLSKISIPGATWNATTQSYQVKGTAYGYGKIVGVASGDSIAYFIQVPNNSSQVWNNGNYNYASTGTGTTQSIPVVANLVPSQTNNQYPTADTYIDVVTATINY